MVDDRIRFMYLRNPSKPSQVLAIGRRWQDPTDAESAKHVRTMEVQFSLNKAPDVFCKRRARECIRNRIERKPIAVEVRLAPDWSVPMEAMEALYEVLQSFDGNFTAKKILKHHLS